MTWLRVNCGLTADAFQRNEIFPAVEVLETEAVAAVGAELRAGLPLQVALSPA